MLREGAKDLEAYDRVLAEIERLELLAAELKASGFTVLPAEDGARDAEAAAPVLKVLMVQPDTRPDEKRRKDLEMFRGRDGGT